MPPAARGYVLRSLSAGEPVIPSLGAPDPQAFLPILYQFGEPNGFVPVVMGLRPQLAAASILPFDPGPGSGSGFADTFTGDPEGWGAFYTVIEPVRYWGKRGVLARVPRAVVILTEPPGDYADSWLDDLKEAVGQAADQLAELRAHVCIAHPGRHGSGELPLTVYYQSAARHPLLAPCLVTGYTPLSYDDGTYSHHTYLCDTNPDAVVGGEVLYIHIARGLDEVSDYIQVNSLNNVASGGDEPEFPPVPAMPGAVVAYNETLELPNPSPPPAINDRGRYTAIIWASKVAADGAALLAASAGYAKLKVILAARPIQYSGIVFPDGYSATAVRQTFMQQLPDGCPVESLTLPADGASAGAALVGAIVEFFAQAE